MHFDVDMMLLPNEPEIESTSNADVFAVEKLQFTKVTTNEKVYFNLPDTVILISATVVIFVVRS